MFLDIEVQQNLKANVLTNIIIPSFANSFEKGEGNKLVGAPPTPYQEDDNNIVSVFINKVLFAVISINLYIKSKSRKRLVNFLG